MIYLRSLLLILLLSATTLLAQKKSTTITQTPPEIHPRDTVMHLDKKPQPIIGVGKVLQYPEEAKRAGIEGSVTVKFKVLRNCKTDSVTVVKSDHPILAKAAVDAIKKCKYLPAMKDKNIVETWTMEKVEFKLK